MFLRGSRRRVEALHNEKKPSWAIGLGESGGCEGVDARFKVWILRCVLGSPRVM